MARKREPKIFENIEVIDAGAKGKSVAKAPDGRVIFINNAVPGDIITVKTFKKRKAYYEGEAIKFHSYSKRRSKPECTHFGVCGGCKWQFMAYKDQLFFKEKEVLQNLKRLGNIEAKKTFPILGCNTPYFYRNKMEFSFSDSKWLTKEEINNTETTIDRRACGFHKPGMWDKIIDIEKCHLQAEPSNAIRNGLKRFAIAHNISFFNPRKQTGFLRTLMIRTSSTGQIMLVLQVTQNNSQKIKLVLDYLADNFKEITSLQYVVNSKGNDSIYDQEVICYKGTDFIVETMEDLQFNINAKSFYQTNSLQAFELYKIVRNFANLSKEDLVYDLYTGTGTIAIFIAKHARKVLGIESVAEAVEDAKKNAAQNKITNTSFFVGDMVKILTPQFLSENGIPDIVITDPPRVGMHKKVVEQLLKIAPKKIVYVSCNSATQARDITLLLEKYTVTQSQAVDMFPQTHHVENVVLLERK